MNLLSDPLLPSLCGESGPQVTDLPGLFANFARDDVRELPFLRPHQQMPWHAFMVQLAALALHRSGSRDISDDPDHWREILRGLTPEWPDDEPWRLVVDDLHEPAFMQPPIPAGSADPYKSTIQTPDDLDVLVTSKNHGVKQATAENADASAWVVALVLLQTTGGFLGSGNYGVARMNGGFATRPLVGLVPQGGAGAHWRRDVGLLLDNREAQLREYDAFAEHDGTALLWCRPWDGERQLGLNELDPWFIEICRRVRLGRAGEGRIVAKAAGSKVARIAAKELKGNVGDPWIPVNLAKEGAAYNQKPAYRVMSAVLFEGREWKRPFLLEWHESVDNVPMTARFDVLSRGQGTTEGHHRREVPIADADQWKTLFDPAQKDRAAELAREMIDNARRLQNPVLKFPLMSLVQGGERDVKLGDQTAEAWARPWLERADLRIDEHFFDHLFTIVETGSHERWARFLQTVARETFADAALSLPIAGMRRIKALAIAEDKLESFFYRNFKDYFPTSQKESAVA
ncbi:MAG: type I-E CRISPR-associated protein Cse1/CasA [Geminicoccaceae bacterium]|nr:type I-E CRISPR-associated protein Cse1/CasA [Geminicoccaceae bacterium]